MDSLRQLSSPTALVVRNGESVAIPAKDVVPGMLNETNNLLDLTQILNR